MDDARIRNRPIADREARRIPRVIASKVNPSTNGVFRRRRISNRSPVDLSGESGHIRHYFIGEKSVGCMYVQSIFSTSLSAPVPAICPARHDKREAQRRNCYRPTLGSCASGGRAGRAEARRQCVQRARVRVQVSPSGEFDAAGGERVATLHPHGHERQNSLASTLKRNWSCNLDWSRACGNQNLYPMPSESTG
jgi:hypothetical protein